MKFSRKQVIISAGILGTIVAVVLVWLFFFQSDQGDKTPPIVSQEATVQENADDIRIRHLTLLEKTLSAAISSGKNIPEPERAVYVSFGKTPLIVQGYAGQGLFDALGLNTLVNPDGTQYAYALNADKTKFQFFASVDDLEKGNVLLGEKKVYSVGTPDLFVLWGDNRILSIEKIPSLQADLSDNELRKKIGLPLLTSCQDIYTLKNIDKPKSGTYTIDISGRATKVFCDMQTDGGGWTLFYANNGHEDSPIAKSYVEMRETMSTEPVLDLSNYEDPYLAGLLEYTHFTSGGSREILIRNRVGDPKKWVKFTFSIARVLEWALGPSVLGKTDYGCIDLPRKGTWSISNNDKKVTYENLIQMMNHGGTSWGVSHEKYFCNGEEKSLNAHIGFYNVNNTKNEDRARSDEGIGGKWGEGNEYRYFIR